MTAQRPPAPLPADHPDNPRPCPFCGESLWRWLTAPQPTTCPTCGRRLSQHPDGGAGGVCDECEGDTK